MNNSKDNRTPFEIGRVCIKTAGRQAGKKAVVVKLFDNNFAIIDGKNLKRKKCNLNHLFPTEQKFDIKEDEKHEVIVKMLK
ncbi:MAG: 50S ribosomal protein L14e [Candidatus Diapherotrites archaeon]|nr:50S ribosomal protein L14e [Candidatus Diapherotrites archaeon]